MQNTIENLLSKHQYKIEAEELVRSRAKDKGETTAWLFTATTVLPSTAADTIPEILTDE